MKFNEHVEFDEHVVYNYKHKINVGLIIYQMVRWTDKQINRVARNAAQGFVEDIRKLEEMEKAGVNIQAARNRYSRSKRSKKQHARSRSRSHSRERVGAVAAMARARRGSKKKKKTGSKKKKSKKRKLPAFIRKSAARHKKREKESSKKSRKRNKRNGRKVGRLPIHLAKKTKCRLL